MNNKEIEQILNIIVNMEEQKGFIPYFSDLQKHPVYGQIFAHVDEQQKNEIRTLINQHMVEKIE